MPDTYPPLPPGCEDWLRVEGGELEVRMLPDGGWANAEAKGKV